MDKLEYKKSKKNTILNFSSNYKKRFISVIIPVYKDVKGLIDTIESLKRQSLSQEKYEIIIANDGGEKEIEEVCCNYKVKMIDIIPNGGAYFARNRALENATGEYIAFVDADIILPQEWLEIGYNLIDKYDYVAGDVKIDEDKVKKFSHYYELNNAFKVEKYMIKYHYGPTANLFVKRNVFEKIGGFDERLRSSGDLEFGDRVYNTNGLTQSYSNKLYCIHPPRDFTMLKKKFKRIAKGHVDLNNIYPKRFNFYNFSYKKLPEKQSKNSNIIVFFIKYYFKLYKLLWKIYYSHTKIISQPEDVSYTIKVKNFKS